MRRVLIAAFGTSLAVAGCSPGPHDNPIIGSIALWLAAVAVTTGIGGIAWLLRHPGRTLVQGLARSLGMTLLVWAMAAGLLVAGALVRTPVERPFAYWPMDARTIGVVLLDAPNLSCEIAGLDESTEAVRIHAQCSHALLPLPGTGMAQKYVLQATLQSPLGDRAVYDGSGRLSARCQAPGLDCTAP